MRTLISAIIIALLAACGGGNSRAPRAQDNIATLTWDAVADSDLAGYRVYYGTTSGVYDQPRGSGFSTTSPTYVVTKLKPGTTYYFAVTSYDAAGNESAFSSEVSKSFN